MGPEDHHEPPAEVGLWGTGGRRMTRIVSYRKSMYERAKAKEKFLVTIDVTGRHLKRDSCCVQVGVDEKTAKKLAKLAVSLLKTAGAE
jgi:hypothetical protein